MADNTNRDLVPYINKSPPPSEYLTAADHYNENEIAKFEAYYGIPFENVKDIKLYHKFFYFLDKVITGKVIKNLLEAHLKQTWGLNKPNLKNTKKRFGAITNHKNQPGKQSLLPLTQEQANRVIELLNKTNYDEQYLDYIKTQLPKVKNRENMSLEEKQFVLSQYIPKNKNKQSFIDYKEAVSAFHEYKNKIMSRKNKQLTDAEKIELEGLINLSKQEKENVEISLYEENVMSKIKKDILNSTGLTSSEDISFLFNLLRDGRFSHEEIESLIRDKNKFFKSKIGANPRRIITYVTKFFPIEILMEIKKYSNADSRIIHLFDLFKIFSVWFITQGLWKLFCYFSMGVGINFLFPRDGLSGGGGSLPPLSPQIIEGGGVYKSVFKYVNDNVLMKNKKNKTKKTRRSKPRNNKTRRNKTRK